jgi:Transposase DDE domain
LNQARIQTEKIIDKLYKALKNKLKNKPKTYRKLARKNYLLVAKQRRPKKKVSGVPLGRPSKNPSIQAKKQAQEDERIRNCIEGKFGQGKRRFSLKRIMTKLEDTSRTSIAITFLVINLSRLLKEALIAFLCQFFARNTIFSIYDYESLCFD